LRKIEHTFSTPYSALIIMYFVNTRGQSVCNFSKNNTF
jgi:hypothetical protein